MNWLRVFFHRALNISRIEYRFRVMLFRHNKKVGCEKKMELKRKPNVKQKKVPHLSRLQMVWQMCEKSAQVQHSCKSVFDVCIESVADCARSFNIIMHVSHEHAES